MNWQEIIFCAIAVVGIIEWIKNLDPEKKLKKFYKFFPVVISIIPAILISNLSSEGSWASVVLNTLVIFSFSTLGYQTIVETIEKNIKNPS